MGVYKLRAISDKAKLCAPEGRGPDLELWQGRPILLGRAVASRRDGYKLPADWAQLSSKHCTLTGVEQEGEVVWNVKDTSTNGTYINGIAIGKDHTAQLKVGDKLSLSYLGSGHTNGPAALLQEGLEWELVFDPEGTPAPPGGAVAAKRKLPVADASVTSDWKKAKSDSDQELLQLRQTNQDLRKQNEQYRASLDELEQRAQQEQEAALQLQREQHAEELKQLQAQATQHKAELQKEHQAAQQQLQDQVDILSKDLEESQQALATAQESLDAERKKAAELATRLAAADLRQQQLQQELATSSEQLQQQLAAAQSAEAAVAEARQQVAAAKEAAAAAQHEAAAGKSAAAEAQAQAAAAVQKRVAAEQAAQHVERQLQAAQRQLTALQEQLGGKKEHLLLQNKQINQIHCSLSELTKEQQERNARANNLISQLQALAAENERATAELLGGISEQFTVLQQGTAEELQVDQAALPAGTAPGPAAGAAAGGASQEGEPQDPSDIMMTQLASSDVTLPASVLGSGGGNRSPLAAAGGDAPAGSGDSAPMDADQAAAAAAGEEEEEGAEAEDREEEQEEDGAAGASVEGGAEDVEGGSQPGPAATLQLLTGRQVTGTYGASVEWQPLTMPLLGAGSTASGAIAAAGAASLGLVQFHPAAGAAAEDGAGKDVDMEDLQELHGATDAELQQQQQQQAGHPSGQPVAATAQGRANLVIQGTEPDEYITTTQDSAQHVAVQQGTLVLVTAAGSMPAAAAPGCEQQLVGEASDADAAVAREQEELGAFMNQLMAAEGEGREQQEAEGGGAAQEHGVVNDPTGREAVDGEEETEETEEEEEEEAGGDDEEEDEGRMAGADIAELQEGQLLTGAPEQRQPLGPVSQQLHRSSQGHATHGQEAGSSKLGVGRHSLTISQQQEEPVGADENVRV